MSNKAPDEIVPDSVTISFYIGGIVFLAAVLWTVFRSKEYSPEEMATFSDNEEHGGPQEDTRSQEEKMVISKGQMLWGGILIAVGIVLSYFVTTIDREALGVKETVIFGLYIVTVGIGIAGVLALLSGLLQRQEGGVNAFVTMVNDIQGMPKLMKQLAWVQFFSWFALFCMWLYTTPGITEHIYGTTDQNSELYNTGANWVGVCFGIYNLVGAAIAFGLPILIRRTSRKITHLICLVLGGIGLLSIYFLTNPDYMIVSMIGVGIAWASILSLPYAMLTGSLPPAKMGYYMGIFNYFIVLPQIIAASILGFILKVYFDNTAIYALIVGGISMIIGGILTLRVDDKEEPATEDA